MDNGNQENQPSPVNQPSSVNGPPPVNQPSPANGPPPAYGPPLINRPRPAVIRPFVPNPLAPIMIRLPPAHRPRLIDWLRFRDPAQPAFRPPVDPLPQPQMNEPRDPNNNMRYLRLSNYVVSGRDGEGSAYQNYLIQEFGVDVYRDLIRPLYAYRRPPQPDDGWRAPLPVVDDDVPRPVHRLLFYLRWPPTTDQRVLEYWPNDRTGDHLNWVTEAQQNVMMIDHGREAGHHTPTPMLSRVFRNSETTLGCTACGRLILNYQLLPFMCGGDLNVVAAVRFACLPCRFTATDVADVLRHFDGCENINPVEAERQRVRTYSHLCGPCGTMMFGSEEQIRNHVHTWLVDPAIGRLNLIERGPYSWSSHGQGTYLAHVMRDTLIARTVHNEPGTIIWACFNCGRFSHVRSMIDVWARTGVCQLCGGIDQLYYCGVCNAVYAGFRADYTVHFFTFEHLYLGYRFLLQMR